MKRRTSKMWLSTSPIWIWRASPGASGATGAAVPPKPSVPAEPMPRPVPPAGAAGAGGGDVGAVGVTDGGGAEVFRARIAMWITPVSPSTIKD